MCGDGRLSGCCAVDYVGVMDKPQVLLVFALMYLVTATMPVFYLALYRNATALVFPKGLRLAAGITAAGVTVESIFLCARFVLHRAPMSRVNAVMYVFFLVLAAVISVLVSIACAHSPGANSQVRVSKFLAIATVVATVAGGALVSYMAVGIVLALFAGGPRQPVLASAAQAVSQLVPQIGLFMAPFLVWLRIRRSHARGLEGLTL